MPYLRINTDQPNAWVQTIDEATPFSTKEQAEAASINVANSTGVHHDDDNDCWFIERNDE